MIIAAGLTALFSLLVFVEQLALVGQGHYRTLDALAYAILTAPNRLLQLAPVSMLLATLVGLGRLARGSELTAFLSCGVSQLRIIGAVMKLCVPLIVARLNWRHNACRRRPWEMPCSACPVAAFGLRGTAIS